MGASLCLSNIIAYLQSWQRERERDRERERERERGGGGSVCVCWWFAKQSSTIHEFSSAASQVHAYIYAYIHMHKVFAYIYIYIYIYCMTTSMISCTNSQRAHTFKCIHMWMPRKLYVHSWCGPSIKIICNSYIHIGQIVTLPCGVSKRKIISHTYLIWGIHTHTHQICTDPFADHVKAGLLFMNLQNALT